jgi:D-lactate dehydrogenase
MEVLKQSDIVSLHCPLNDQTKHLINQTSLNLMKDGVMLINTMQGRSNRCQSSDRCAEEGKAWLFGY